MPDIAGITLQDLQQFVGNLFANPKPVPADSFFQTRTTHTPGAVEQPDPARLASFDPSLSPIAKVQASNLPPEIKQKLIDQWKALGKGYIHSFGQPPTSAPTDLGPQAIKHEEVHAIQQDPRYAAHQSDIAGKVSAPVQRYLASDPVYQEESRRLGSEKVRALEGLAVDLTDTSVPANKSLRDYVGKLLGPKADRELKQLSAR